MKSSRSTRTDVAGTSSFSSEVYSCGYLRLHTHTRRQTHRCQPSSALNWNPFHTRCLAIEGQIRLDANQKQCPGHTRLQGGATCILVKGEACIHWGSLYSRDQLQMPQESLPTSPKLSRKHETNQKHCPGHSRLQVGPTCIPVVLQARLGKHAGTRPMDLRFCCLLTQLDALDLD